MRRRLAFLMVLTLMAAGCFGGGSKSAPTTSSAAATPTLGDDTSSITGHVVDDEGRPIPGAEVGILELKTTASSDAQGAFTFNEVEPGTYTVAAQRLGYDAAQRRVTVTLEEVAEVTIQLRPIAVGAEPYQVTRQSTAYFKQSWYYVDRAAPVLNQTAVYQQTCDPCVFQLYFPKGAKEALTETHWKRAVTQPGINENLEPYYCIGWTVSCTADGTLVWRDSMTSRESTQWSQAGVDAIKKLETMRLEVLAGFPGVMFQQRVDVYTSFAYLGGFPENFTALPPSG